VLALTYF